MEISWANKKIALYFPFDTNWWLIDQRIRTFGHHTSGSEPPCNRCIVPTGRSWHHPHHHVQSPWLANCCPSHDGCDQDSGYADSKSLNFSIFFGPFPNNGLKIQYERSIFIWRKKRQGRLPWFHAHWLSWMLSWFLPKYIVSSDCKRSRFAFFIKLCLTLLRLPNKIELIYRLFGNKFQHFVYLRVNTCYFHTGKILHFKKQIILLGYHWHLFLKSWFCKRFCFEMQTFHIWGNVLGCLKKMRTTFSMW